MELVHACGKVRGYDSVGFGSPYSAAKVELLYGG